MSLTSNYAVTLLEYGISMLSMAYIAVSIIMFIVDGIKAKREQRNIKTKFKIMFITALILAGIIVLVVIAFIVLLVFGIAVYASSPSIIG
jgi:K+-transporting ATPase A subunit